MFAQFPYSWHSHNHLCSGEVAVEEVPPWSTLEALKGSEVDFRPLHKPPAGVPGAVPFPLLSAKGSYWGRE